jgi:hypothetical protein
MVKFHFSGKLYILFRHKETNFIVAIKKILKRNIPIEDSVYLIR